MSNEFNTNEKIYKIKRSNFILVTLSFIILLFPFYLININSINNNKSSVSIHSNDKSLQLMRSFYNAYLSDFSSISSSIANDSDYMYINGKIDSYSNLGVANFNLISAFKIMQDSLSTDHESQNNLQTLLNNLNRASLKIKSILNSNQYEVLNNNKDVFKDVSDLILNLLTREFTDLNYNSYITEINQLLDTIINL